MINIRKNSERGITQLEWLESFHTFSFSDYYDSRFIRFSSLRVINEDTIHPSTGFGRHPHHDMEIITYVVEGSLEHKDNMGSGSIIRPGEIQRMSAGSGIEHSEYNHSSSDRLHLLQIWILPEEKNLKPNYEQKTYPQNKNEFILIGARDGGENAVTIHQDVELYVAHLTQNKSIQYDFQTQRSGWIQLIKGQIDLNGLKLSAGDGASITGEHKIEIKCIVDAELIFFNLN